ncbi:hypothetical protein [Paracoccus sulfuroxidans]|uniref:hypothetical protein n=1 Tax=Paracoccus sulfuroxidans TaxID=384678 RepID=UPI0011A9C2C7|nr:hypothetical protein [Paracoccus sulfuroxidans]
MTELPKLDHAQTSPHQFGFMVLPSLDTPEGHAAFQASVTAFAATAVRWKLNRTRAGRYEAWDCAVFERFERCIAH